MAQKPTLIFVPGVWESHAGVFAEVVKTLREEHGFSSISVASLPSTGQASPGNPSLQDDIAAVRASIAPAVERGRDVLLVLHSAGGYIGSAAAFSLTARARAAQGLPGGVVGMAMVTAGIFPAGTATTDLPFFEYTDKYRLCVSPRERLFNDLDDAGAALWMARMQPQPATGWDGVLHHAAHSDVPCHYLVCEGDMLAGSASKGVEMQEAMAATAGATVHRCSAGHMVMLSQPGRLVQFIREVADEVGGR